MPNEAFDQEQGWSVAADAGRILVGSPAQFGGTRRVGLFDVCDAGQPELVGLIQTDPADTCDIQFPGFAVDLEDGFAVTGTGSAFFAPTAVARYSVDEISCPPVIPVTDKILADDGTPFASFGESATMDDNRLFVGAWNADTTEINAGAVYEYDAQTGQQIQKITPSTPEEGARFGIDVDAADGLLVVGSSFFDQNAPNGGWAWVFDATTGLQVDDFGPMTPPGGALENAYFGQAVAIESPNIIVGAPGTFSAGGVGYVSVHDSATRQFLRHLIPYNSAPNDAFGSSVDLDGGIAVVGAPESGSDGAAFLFDVNTGQQLHQLVPSVPLAGGDFGAKVAIEGNHAVVTARSAFLGVGTEIAYLFDVTTGQELAHFMAFGVDPFEVVGFGLSVALTDTSVLVGATTDSYLGNQTGVVHKYDRTTFEQTARYAPVAQPGAPGAVTFGTSIATDGQRLFFGDNSDAEQGFAAGAGYLLQLDGAPPVCAADCDDSGALNIDDIDCFIAAFLASDLATSDCDGNGSLNIDDIDCFVAAFLAGCP